MQRLILSVFLIFPLFTVMGQTDIPVTRKLNLTSEPQKGVAPNSGVGVPSLLGKKLPQYDLGLESPKKGVQMLPNNELKQAGHDLVLKPNIAESESNGSSGKHFGDMYLGDIKTGAKFVGVVCRDHEYVDGDRVRILVNGDVAEPNILLTGSFKGINLELTKGFNRIDFEALNQGSSGPNTAQVDVYDEAGKLLYSNKWLLSTGSKATLIIVKD
jgi:hypothetical protein